MLDGVIQWLTNLPPGTLYVAILLLSAFENFFPPFPSDGVIAFGSFLVARAHGSLLTVFLLGLMGNTAGASTTYFLARRFGSEAVLRRLEKFAGPTAEQRLKDLYSRYGVGALFVSRFLPGVRAIVPPFAGAMKLPALPVLGAITAASAVWFGLIAFLTFQAGDDWDFLRTRLVRSGTTAIAIAGSIIVVTVLVWWIRRKRAAT
jgi:membrane protein DedA with SNARE-associated domain